MFPLALEDTTMDWMLLASRWYPPNIFPSELGDDNGLYPKGDLNVIHIHLTPCKYMAYICTCCVFILYDSYVVSYEYTHYVTFINFVCLGAYSFM